MPLEYLGNPPLASDRQEAASADLALKQPDTLEVIRK